MKKMIFVIPVRLDEEGTLSIKEIESLRLLVCSLKENYEITLLVQSYRDKMISALSDLEIPIIYDNSISGHQSDTSHCLSRFQSSYCRWSVRRNVSKETNLSEYDCLFAWDGCSPWCLATALKPFNVKKRFVWIHDDPKWYLMTTDHAFYSDICSEFDAMIASNEKIKKELDTICKNRKDVRDCVVVKPPMDASWYWEQSEYPVDYEFQPNKANLLIISKMCLESSFEQLPKWLSEHQNQCSSLHCYVLGNGERFDRYIQQIAIYSADTMITLMGQIDNPYPYIRGCDALLICKNDRQPDVETGAQIFKVPIIWLDELEQHLSKLSKKERLERFSSVIWDDKEKFIKILKEE